MSQDLCIAIAVARPEGLEYLPGAVPSARRFAAWAHSQGYVTEVVTDEADPVTCTRLAEVLHRHLGDGGQRRVMVSFAGHGVIRGGAEEYWLLTRWRRSATEAVNHLKLRDRLGTYLPSQLAIVSDACRSLITHDAKWVEGNGVVDVKDYVEKPVHVAHLAGTRSAQPAYSTPLEAAEAYCFFTQVLTKALNGKPDDVVETDAAGRRVVLNDTLFRVVERELPLLASAYGRGQVPELSGTWRAPDNVWGEVQESSGENLILPSNIETIANRGVELPGGVDPAERRAEAFTQRLKLQPRPVSFETGTGVVVHGMPAVEVVTSSRYDVEWLNEPGWFRLHPRGGPQCGSVAIRLDDGTWIAAAVYTGFIGAFTLDEGEAAGYVLRPSGQDPRVAERAVAAAASGLALSDPFDMAARLRDQKHADPVLGALAAYAYARAGAIDDIRRLCDFYRQRGQPVPFDAVLLGRLRTVRDAEGLFALVPPVESRQPRTALEERRPWTYQTTPGGRVAVAGGFPWLRQGWALLEDDFRPEFRTLSRFAWGVRPGVFTTLNPAAGRELAAAISKGDL